MFRSLVVVATLIGMTLCQHRCMTGCGRTSDANEVAAAGCPCCQHEKGGERPAGPCDPAGDGDCRCQGVCGGAITGEAFAIDGLLKSWSDLSLPIDAPVVAASLPPAPRDRSDGAGVTVRGAADGRGLRILIASLQT